MRLTNSERVLVDKLVQFESLNNELLAKLKEADVFVNHFANVVSTHERMLKTNNPSIDKHKNFTKQALDKREEELNKREAAFEVRQQKLKLYEMSIIDTKNEVIQLEELLNLKSKRFPWLAGAIADLVRIKTNEVAEYLTSKPHPAFSTAQKVIQVGREKRILVEQLKFAQYTIQQYEGLFPFLIQFREDEIEEELLEIRETFGEKLAPEEDPVKMYITPGEYTNLSPTERNQRALDRYLKARKSNFQIGRDYERYVGYLYECKGYKVSYYGIEKGIEDLGRDLICEKDGKTEVVQCKYWSKHKQIHENHINQLFGTTVMFYLDSAQNLPKRQQMHLFPQLLAAGNITPVFYTSTELSDTAQNFAQALGIVIHERIPLDDYPRIKCHISTLTGERIYHLPFDQMYDRTKLDKPGEFYAMTVAQAETAGFRRAWRWQGSL